MRNASVIVPHGSIMNVSGDVTAMPGGAIAYSFDMIHICTAETSSGITVATMMRMAHHCRADMRSMRDAITFQRDASGV